MRDFLRGTLGMVLRVVLGFASIVSIISGLNYLFSNVAVGIVLLVLGLLFGCASYGVKYWLGNIYRLR